MNAEEFWYHEQNAASDFLHVSRVESDDGFEMINPPSEPYSPSLSEDEQFDAESISSISDVNDRPIFGAEYNTSDEERDAEVAAPVVGEEMAQAIDVQIRSVVFQHVISGCCHIAKDSAVCPDDGDAIVLKCGKLASKNFEQVQLAGNFLPYKCSRCFAGT